jgi:hypothetical protein
MKQVPPATSAARKPSKATPVYCLADIWSMPTILTAGQHSCLQPGIFIACVDGLKGFPETIEAVFPKTTVQLCVVHMVRHSMNFVGWK